MLDLSKKIILDWNQMKSFATDLSCHIMYNDYDVFYKNDLMHFIKAFDEFHGTNWEEELFTALEVRFEIADYPYWKRDSAKVNSFVWSVIHQIFIDKDNISEYIEDEE